MNKKHSALWPSTLLVLVVGCGVVSIEGAPASPAANNSSADGDKPRNLIAEARARDDAEAASQAAAALPVDPGNCPSDMSRTPGALVVATYGDSLAPPSRTPIVKEHEKPLRTDKKFARAPSDAMDSLVALEHGAPGLVPLGFRDELAKSPRDAALRLRMARCEMQKGLLLRRAAVDLGAALLLGTSPDDVAHDLDTVRTGRDCYAIVATLHRDQAKACDEAERAVVADKPSKVSAKEFATEDAVSRGLATLYAEKPATDEPKRGLCRGLATLYAEKPATDEPKRGLSGLLLGMIHRCGPASVCSVNVEKVWDDGASALAKPRQELVHWDNNVRGSVVEVADPPALKAAKKRCLDATDGHWESRGPCLNGCIGTFDPGSCRMTCISSCAP